MKNLIVAFFISLYCNMFYAQGKTNIRKDSIAEKVFKFYPNPVEDELFVLGTHKIKSIEFIDVLGKQVAIYYFNKSIIRIDVSQLKSGIYLMRVIDKNNRQDIKKLMVK